MSDTNRPVIERNADGEFSLTSYGEFLSFYHSHLQIFKKILMEKQIPAKKIDSQIEQIKKFMVANVKKVSDFTDHIHEFASFLSMRNEQFNSYMGENFFPILTKVQQKLVEQEVELKKSLSSDSYHLLTEEIVDKLGEFMPAGSRFVIIDNLLVIENMKTGALTEPGGVLKEIKNDQEASAEKKIAKKEKPKTPQSDNEPRFLNELVETFKDEFFGSPIDVSVFLPQMEAEAETVIKEPEKPKPILDEIPDLDFEEEELEIKTEPKQATIDSVDLDDILAGVGGAETSSPKKDEADSFSLKEYQDLQKIVLNYKQKGDKQAYANWLNSETFPRKCVVSIKNALSSEKAGQSINWQDQYKAMGAKSGLSITVIQKLHLKVKHFEFVRGIFDFTVKEFKNFPPNVLQLAKNGWPHFLKAYEKAPDYSEVETGIRDILSKIKDPTLRSPIENILLKGLNKIKSDFETNYKKLSQ
ncbi:MAG: hypothetical protein H7A25_16965 [Leptospiraceae bacterium]|nr:hypothetical protein [Leptospiraceae bacterium]MCP5501596.1 hypothetical protein [Leptospiraceae bacterium]